MYDLRWSTRRACRGAVVAALWASLACGGSVAATDDVDGAEPIVSLRNDGRFAEAETHGRRQVEDSTLDPARRSSAAIELVRTLTLHAQAASGKERETLWRETQDDVARFARLYPRDPRLLLVRAQGALALAAEAQARRDEAQCGAGDDAALEPARLAARRAVKAWAQLRADVAAARRAAGAGRSSGRGLSAAELAALDNHLAHQMALAHVNQAACFGVGSADHVAAVAAAAQLLDGLKNLPADDPVHWPSRVLDVTCLRLLGKPAAAERVLSQFASEDPPPIVAAPIAAERIRVALALGRIQRAAEWASDAVPRDEPHSAELALARLEALLAAWRDAAARRLDASLLEWQTRLLEETERLREGGSPAALAGAQRLLTKAAQTTPSPTAHVLWERAAELAYLGGQLDESIAAYDRAAAAARQRGQPERAFELALAAGLIEHERKRHSEAAERLARAALAQAEHARAPAAHALAVAHAGELAAAEPQSELPKYRQMLLEHLARWPNAPTAGEVGLRLGRVAAEQQDWPAAVQAWRAVPPEDANYHRAILGAAQVLIERSDGGGHEAEELLRAALAHQRAAAPADDGWPHTAHVALAVALAAQQKFDQAQRIVDKLPTDPVCHRLRLAAKLAQLRAPQPSQRAALDEVRTLALAPLVERREHLSAAVRRAVDQLGGDADPAGVTADTHGPR